MGKKLEESVMNSIMGICRYKGQVQASNSDKSYMAIGKYIPKVGEHYKCKRLEKNSKGEFKFCSTETTTVQEVKKLADNVFVVSTRNSFYVTRVLYMPVENVHFAIVKSEPQIGFDMNCYKLEFDGEESRCEDWYTTTVQEVKRIHGLYKVKTNKSVYICFPM